MPPLARAALLDELRARVAAPEGARAEAAATPFGIDALDGRLAGGGILPGLHEVAPAAPALAEEAAATLFLAGVAARLGAGAGVVLWVVTRFDLYAPGLEQAGLPPGRLLFGELRDDRDVLAVMEDALRHGGLAAVVGEVRRADMTATRRLQLAAAEHAVPALLFRRWRRLATCPLGEPSAALTRWRIGCAPSAPLGIPGVGRHRWRVELVRQRGGDPFDFLLESCDAKGRLALPAAPRDRAAAAGRSAAIAA